MTEPILLKNPPRVIAEAAVVGSKEAEGPLGEKFDYRDTSDRFGKPTYEQAESEMQHIAMNLALHKRKLHPEDIDLLLAGDLMNQCTASAYGLLPFRVPYLGLYGACSTSAEGLCLGAMLLSGGLCDRLGVVVSSHYATAERQFRFPLEYGAQRAPTAQWTVTGSGAFLLQASAGSPADPTIPDILPGRILSAGITDLNNMGAAMAPVSVKLRPYPIRK